MRCALISGSPASEAWRSRGPIGVLCAVGPAARVALVLTPQLGRGLMERRRLGGSHAPRKPQRRARRGRASWAVSPGATGAARARGREGGGSHPLGSGESGGLKVVTGTPPSSRERFARPGRWTRPCPTSQSSIVPCPPRERSRPAASCLRDLSPQNECRCVVLMETRLSKAYPWVGFEFDFSPLLSQALADVASLPPPSRPPGNFHSLPKLNRKKGCGPSAHT